MRRKPSQNYQIKQTEHQLQTVIGEWLQYKGWFVWRNNSGMIATGVGKYRRMIKLGQSGLPDLFAVKDGILLGVEVKKPSNKPTEVQKRMLEELEQHGAMVLVAHSVNEVEQYLASL